MTLLAPAFLAGLLAVALPLWLHRLSSTNPNRRAFSSLMFLEAGEPRRVLAKRLQYLLLLSLRIAFLVLLALLFAQPAWLRSPQAAAGDGAELHLLVVDASASMSHAERWERAEEAAGAVLDGLGSGDFAQIVAAGRVPEIVAQPTEDLAVARQALSGIEPTAFRVDYGQLMNALDGVLRAAELPVVMHLVTDAQRSAMPGRFAELGPGAPAELVVHDVSADADANWAVERFGGSPLTGELAAGLRSFAAEPAERTVRLTLNDSVVEQRSVTIEPGGRADVEFDALELEAGGNRVSVALEPGDALEVDDLRHLALKRPEPRSVLIVTGPGASGRDDLFVRAALGTLDALALETETVSPAGLDEAALADYSFVVVTDAGLLGGAASERLEGYVEDGGGLLLALGPRSNALDAVPVAGQRLASGGSSAAMRPESAASISGVDATHPVMRGLEGLRSARFFRHVPLEVDEGNVLARLDDGAPLLVERAVGAGRTLVLASTLDREWNDLPVQPAYVGLVAGIANHLLGGAGFSNEATLGSTLSVRRMGMEGGQIFDPRGEPALGLGGGSGDVVLERPGFYEVVGGGRTELVAVNPDPRESDLAALDAETLQRWEALGAPADEQGAAPATAGPGAAVPVSLAPWLLLVLIAMVLMESLVGNWHLRVRRGFAT